MAVEGVWAGCMASLAAVSTAKAREVGSRRMYLCVFVSLGFGPPPVLRHTHVDMGRFGSRCF